MCVYLLQSPAYLKRSSVPAMVKQPPRPADTREERIIYSYEIITSAQRDECHQPTPLAPNNPPSPLSHPEPINGRGRRVHGCKPKQKQVGHRLLLIAEGEITHTVLYMGRHQVQINHHSSAVCFSLRLPSAYVPLRPPRHASSRPPSVVPVPTVVTV